MKIQLAAIGIIAAATLAACETTNNTNTNRPSTNANTATVTGSNTTAPVSANSNTVNSNSNTTTNSNRAKINYNGTAKENESERSSVEAEAKGLGSNIGQGAEDWWLFGKTRAALLAENDLRDSTINVDVVNSVITLRGNVANQAQVAAANKVAKTITGQKGVVNKLTVNAKDTAVPNVTTNSNTAPTKKG